MQVLKFELIFQIIIYQSNSFPDSDCSIIACGVQLRVIMVYVKSIDGAIVAFEAGCDVSFFDIDEFDGMIGASHGQAFCGLIKCESVADVVTCIQSKLLLNHSDVPQFDDTVRITSCYILTTN